ncbi:MAG: hypothetical protein KKC39_03035 [Candidatus Omnitrophica bacterium]|nr:hypothetical protein [Candidatus Omnitrophota bacterium]MBU4467705.1 hypothetical protein [Candidatus Omnitrophota bacterium]
MPSGGYVWVGGWGCLLPLLIIFNLAFGRLIFNSVGLWLVVEAVLILIFMLKIRLMVSRISQQFEQQGRSRGKVIDVKGEVVQEKQKLQ